MEIKLLDKFDWAAIGMTAFGVVLFLVLVFGVY